jgi:hypothetical protein
MKFNAVDKSIINNVLEIREIEDYAELLVEEVFNFLKSKNNLKTIVDQVIFSPMTIYRSYDSYRLTKFLLPDFNITTFLESLLSEMTPPYLVFVDFHFLIEIPPKNIENEESINTSYDVKNFPDQLKFQNGTKASSLNSNIKIFNSSDYENLISEFKNFLQMNFLIKHLYIILIFLITKARD